MRVGETVVAGRSIFTGILHDITERNRKQKMLHESEKFAATGRIAARIAHEINNPLASIKNSFLLVKDAIEPAHPYFNYVARIESEIDRIARIVRQMFKQYRPTQVTLREIHLGDTIRDVVALLNTITTTQGVRLDVDIAGGCDLARLPDDSVRQVLYNIIVNAIEASPAGGAVTVRAALENARVEISVSDQGEGIAAAIRSQIYEPFFTTKHEQGGNGLGLGLSISRSLVEAIQGTLDFENAPAQGTVFHISIPVLSVATKESEAAHA